MRILIPLDGSDLSESALERVRPLAEATQAEVHLLRVYHASGTLFLAEAANSWRGRASASHEFGFPLPAMPEPLERYDQAVARLTLEGEAYLREKGRAFPHLTLVVKVIDNRDITGAIVGYARAIGFDLIAMASRDRSKLVRLALGSAPGRIAAAGVAPVMEAGAHRGEPALQALIFDEEGTSIVEQCLGADPFGRCPRATPDGLAACAARRIMTLTPAGMVGGSLDVAPTQKGCPLAAFRGV